MAAAEPLFTSADEDADVDDEPVRPAPPSAKLSPVAPLGRLRPVSVLVLVLDVPAALLPPT